MICLSRNAHLALLQSSIAGRTRLSISWCNVASDATQKERNYDRIQKEVICMGLLDAIFGNNQPPKINSILPTAAKNEIRAGRLPILNTDSLFLKRGEKIHYIDKAINLEIKVVKQYRHVGHSTPGLLKGNR